MLNPCALESRSQFLFSIFHAILIDEHPKNKQNSLHVGLTQQAQSGLDQVGARVAAEINLP
jgi:hypothetical protein